MVKTSSRKLQPKIDVCAFISELEVIGDENYHTEGMWVIGLSDLEALKKIHCK